MLLQLPDIASQPLNHDFSIPLDWVGMENIALPLHFLGSHYLTHVNAYVNLNNPLVQGIHMSRLYTALLDLPTHTELSLTDIEAVLTQFLGSHRGLSTQAKIEIQGELLLNRPALVSHLSGWKSYPFSIHATLIGGYLEIQLNLEITYSSTCPCSAALARHLIQQRLQDAIHQKTINPANTDELIEWIGSQEGIAATPHSQRSFAQLQFKLTPNTHQFPLLSFINLAEQALGTPVQTAVKRVDEQAFALANGQNLMFCEDALRRLYLAFIGNDAINGFYFKVIHAESLHAHDAIAQGSWQW